MEHLDPSKKLSEGLGPASAAGGRRDPAVGAAATADAACTGGLLLVADRWSVLEVSAARTTLTLQQQQDSSKETPDTCDFKLLSMTTHTSAMNRL